jgi:hypothetical protein
MKAFNDFLDSIVLQLYFFFPVLCTVQYSAALSKLFCRESSQEAIKERSPSTNKLRRMFMDVLHDMLYLKH